MSESNSSESKSRAVAYAFGASVIATIAFYVGWEANETAIWLALLGTAIPFGGLVVATARTWPRKGR